MTTAVEEQDSTDEINRFPYRRDIPDLTLGTLRDEVERPGEVVPVSTGMIRVDFASPVPTIDLGGRVALLGDKGIEAISDILDVPTKFLLRQEPAFRQIVLTHLLESNPGTISWEIKDDELIGAREPGTRTFDPRQLVNIAARVFGDDAQVIKYTSTPGEFSFDTTVSETNPRGTGGDRAIGDITRGGARFFLDRQHNLSPSVQPFLHRLVCTNGMEKLDSGLKIDSRGQTVDDVLAELEIMAERVFSRIESDIEHFYSLREERVTHPERELDRMLREMHLPDRTIQAMVRAIPAMIPEDNEVTRFDLVNLVTHFANNPAMRSGQSQRLQRAGGEIVSAHAMRCSHCASKLDN